MSTDLTVTFDSSGYAGVIRQIDTLEAKLKNIGKGSTFGSFDQQLAKAGTKGGADFARNFKSSTNNMGIGSIATRSLTAAGQTAGKAFSSAFKVATTGLAVGGVAAAVGGAAVAVNAIKTAASFESQIRSTALLTGATGDQLAANQERLAATAKELGASTSFSARQVAEAASFTTLAGFDIDQSIAALPAILDGAAASGSELATVSDIVTDSLSALGKGAEFSNELVDVLVATTTKSNTNFEQLGQALSFAAVDATALGIPVETTAAALGILADNGIKATRGGTGLRRVLARLKAPTDDANSALKELGVEVFDTAGKFAGFDTVFEDLSKSIQGLDDETRSGLLSDIFGIQGEGIATILANNIGAIKGLDSELDNALGTSQQVADGQLDTLSGQLEILKSALEGAKIAFDEPLLEPLKDFASSFGSIVQDLIPVASLVGEKLAASLIPRAESFATFANDFGNQIGAALSGDAFRIDFGDLFAIGGNNQGELFGQINIADFFFIDFDKSGVSLLEIGDFFSFENLGLTGDSGSGKFINIADFITIDFDAAGVSLLEIGDFFSFENLGLTGDAGSGKFINIADFITFEFGGDNGFTKLSIGDFFDATLQTLFSGGTEAQINLGENFFFAINKDGIENLEIGDFVSFAKGDGGSLNLADFITVDFGASLGDIQKLNIGDLISLDNTGGQNLLKIGDLVEFDFAPVGAKIKEGFNTLLAGEFTFDFSALKSNIQAQFNSFVDFFSADAGANDPSQLGGGQSAFAGLAESLQGQIAGIIPDDFSLPNLDTVTSFFDDLTDIGGIEFALPDLSPIKEFFSNLIGITKSNNSSSFGPSEFSLFPQADDLFSGAGESGDLFSSLLDLRNKAVSSFSELAQGVLSGGAELTEAIDGSRVGELVSGFANTFVSKFDELVSGANITGVAEAAGSLVSAIGSKIGEAASDDGFSLVGSSIASLASNLIGQIGSVFSSEQLAADLGQGVGETVNAAAQIAGSIGVGISAELAKIDTDVLVTSIADIGTNVGSALATAAEQIDGADLVSKLSEIGSSLGIFASNVNDTLNERAAEVERNADPQTRLDPFAVSEVGLPGADLSAAALLSAAAADSLASSYSVAADNAGLLSETALGTGAAIGSITSSLQSLNEAAIAGGNNAMDLTSGALPDFFFDSDAIQEQARQSLGASDAVILNAQFQFPEVIETQPGPLAAIYETYADAETQPGPLSADYVEYADAETQPGPLAGGYVTYEAAAAQPGPLNGFYRSVKDPPIPKDVKIPFSWQPTNSPTPPAGSSSSGTPTIPNIVGANASGTTFFRGGRTRIAERGPEIVTLPSGAKFLALNNSEMSLPRGTRIQNATDSENELTQREGGRSGVSSPLLRRAANRTARLANSTTGVRTSGNTTLDKSQLISTSSGAALVALNKSKVNLGANTSVLGQLESQRALLGGNALSALATSIQDSVTLAELSSQAQAAAALAQAAALADLSSSGGGGGNNSQSLSENISSGSSNSSDPFGFLDLLDEGLAEFEAEFEAELAAFEDEAAAYQEALFASINDFPAFAKGTERFRGGLALVGENGPELVRFPMGSNARIFPNHQSQRMAALMDNMASVNSDPSLAERRMRVANYNYHHNVNTVTNDSRQTVTRYGDKRTQNTTIHNYSPDPELHSNRAARRFAGGR